MSQDQELIGLQSRLAFNLARQEETQKVIAEQEQILYNLELEQVEFEKDILSLQVLNEVIHEENTQGNEESFNAIMHDITVHLNQNEHGETIQ